MPTATSIFTHRSDSNSSSGEGHGIIPHIVDARQRKKEHWRRGEVSNRRLVGIEKQAKRHAGEHTREKGLGTVVWRS